MMKNWIRKAEQELLTRRALCGLIVQMTIILVAPLLYIGQYNHAAGDCYWFAFKVHCAWLNTHNLWNVLMTAFQTVAEYYVSWQGTFSSIFLFSLSPVAFGEQYMVIVPYMMIGMTFISTFLLFYVFLKKILCFDWYTYLAVTCIASVMQVTFMYTPASGMYWYNGAVHYVFMQGFVNLMVAFSVLLLLAAGRAAKSALVGYSICAAVATLMASGANFTTTLLNVELAVILELAAVILWKKSHNKKYLLNTIPFAVSVIGFLVNVLAPGNAVRQASFTQGTFLGTVLRSFSYSASQAVLWIDIFVILMLLMLLPMILKAVSRTDFRFPCPILVIAGCYCLYASMFAPGFYAFGGGEPLSRNQNICKMFLLICLVLCEIYLAGWLVKRVRFPQWLVPVHGKSVLVWFAAMVVFAAVFVSAFGKLGFVEKKATFVSYGAYDVIKTGDGEAHMEEYLIRLNQYKNSEEDVLYVLPYTVKPYPLWVSLETEESKTDDGQLSDILSKWYGKTAIYEVRPE